MITKRIWITVGLFLFLANFSNDAEAAEIKQGNPAPDFELSTLDGKSIKLTDYKGKKVILNFWASWCAPCKSEMPIMEEYHKLNKNEDIVILAINLTNEDQSIKTIEKFAANLKLTFPILLDEKGQVSDLYQILSIPTTYFIDEEGTLQQKVVGPLNKKLIKKLIKET